MSAHVLPLRVYLSVFGALLALTALTTWVAYLDLGVLNTALALAIASLKGILVVLYFMHVRYATSMVRILAVVGLLFLLILLGFTIADYATRTPVPGWS